MINKAKKAKSYISLIIAIGIMLCCYPSLGRADTNPYKTEYLARAGDTLDSVAGKYGVDVELVAAMNNISPISRLYQGQKIFIPREPETEYVLKPGDTLWDISQKYQVKVDLLINYNRVECPKKLQVGQVIKIPLEGNEAGISVPYVAVLSTSTARGTSEFLWPVKGVITSPYGWRKDPFTGKMEFHHGTDIGAGLGTPILAAKSGDVVFSGYRSVYGNTVIIDHGYEMETLYAHISQIHVQEGETVEGGQIIGEVGVSGRTTGPHLHFEVHLNDESVNPRRYLQ